MLVSPHAYKVASPKLIGERSNGAGPEGFDRLVPDRIWGLNINPAANIHDWMYWDLSNGTQFWAINHPLFGREIFVEVNKGFADIFFLVNILMLIDTAKGFWFLRWARRYRAMTYFNFVKDVGDFAITKPKKGEGK